MTRLSGSLGIHWILHIGLEEIYKFVFLHVK